MFVWFFIRFKYSQHNRYQYNTTKCNKLEPDFPLLRPDIAHILGDNFTEGCWQVKEDISCFTIRIADFANYMGFTNILVLRFCLGWETTTGSLEMKHGLDTGWSLYNSSYKARISMNGVIMPFSNWWDNTPSHSMSLNWNPDGDQEVILYKIVQTSCISLEVAVTTIHVCVSMTQEAKCSYFMIRSHN